MSTRTGGQWQPEMRISLADGFGDRTPDLCFTPAGVTWVVWQASDGTDDEILWSRSSGAGATSGVADRSAPALVRWWPNPARDRVCFELPSGRALPEGLRIYNAAGRLVRALSSATSGTLPSSDSPLLIWDCRDQEGKRVPQGCYVYRSESGGRCHEGALILLR